MEKALEHVINEEQENQEIIRRAGKMLDNISTGDKVCLMRKALYGLRQAGCVWHKRLDEELRRLRATPINADPCIYLKKERNQLIVIVVYVDDILILSRSKKSIEDLRDRLKKSFDVNDLDELKHCLGMDFERRENGIHVYQAGYIQDVLRRFRMMDCNSVSTPLDASTKLYTSEPWDEHDGKRPPYRELVRALLYLSITTGPDIAHAASLLSQYNESFRKVHWAAAKRVLRYLKGSAQLGIVFSSRQGPLTGFVDADWGGSVDDRRSFTGYAFVWNGGIVSWESKKQRTVALSSTESEYMALGEAAKEPVLPATISVESWHREPEES